MTVYVLVGLIYSSQSWGLFFAHHNAVWWHKPAVGYRVPTEVKAFENMQFDPAWGLPTLKFSDTRPPPLCKHLKFALWATVRTVPFTTCENMGTQFNPGT